MLKVSRRLYYGVQLVFALAMDETGGTVPTSQISERLDIPLPFLHQIAHTLIQGGLIKATPGPKGGLRLSRPIEKITLLDVFEALEGRVSLPITDDEVSDNEETKIAFDLWENIGDEVTALLARYQLSDLLK